MSSTAIIILAAGASRRLGSPKQLLLFRGKSLLQHTIDESLAFSDQVFVVLGHHQAAIAAQLQAPTVQIVVNEAWEEGMASSIRCGLRAAEMAGASTVIFLVSDQPFVSKVLLERMVDAQEKSGQPIVACRYAETIGIPVLFQQRIFTALYGLQGDSGAKKLVMQYLNDTVMVDFPEGNIDIDTAADYHQLDHD